MQVDRGARQDPAEVTGAQEGEVSSVALAGSIFTHAARDLARETCADVLQGRPEQVLGTEGDIAAMTRLGPSTVRRLRARGAIPGAVKVGRSRRYVLETVRAWAAASCPPRSAWTGPAEGAR
jgi:hypothetical protein